MTMYNDLLNVRDAQYTDTLTSIKKNTNSKN